VASPILCNIYLHKLDHFVENTLILNTPEGTNEAETLNTSEYVTPMRAHERKETRKKRGNCAEGRHSCPA
jgi:hypothetical protein